MRYQRSKGDNSPEDLSKWPDKIQRSTESLTSEECNEATSDQALFRWLHQIWTISNNVTSRLKYFLRVSPSSRTSSSDGSLETNSDKSSSDELTTLNDAVETEEESIGHRDGCACANRLPCGHRIPHRHLCVPGLQYGNDSPEEYRVIEENNHRSPEIKLSGNVFLRNSIPHRVLILPGIRHDNNGPRTYVPDVFQPGVRTSCRYDCETKNYQVYWNEYGRTRHRRMEDLVGYEIPERLNTSGSLKPKSVDNVDKNDCQRITNLSNRSSKRNDQIRMSGGSSIQSSKKLNDSLVDAKSEKNCWDSRLSDIKSQDASSNDGSKDGFSLGSSLRSDTEENISIRSKIDESQDERLDEPETSLQTNTGDEEKGDLLKANVIDSETKSKTPNQVAATNELCQERKFSSTTESCFDTLLTSLRAKMNTLKAETHLNSVQMSTSVTAEKAKRSFSSMTDPNVDNINCTLEKYGRTMKECQKNCDGTRPSFTERIQDIWQDSGTVPWNSFYKEEPLKFISNVRKEPATMSIFGFKKHSGLAECFGEYGTAVKLANILEAMTESQTGKSADFQEQEIFKISEKPQRFLPDEFKSKISHIGIQYSSSALATENENPCRNENSEGHERFGNKLVSLSNETPRSVKIFTEHSILPVSTIEIKPLTHQIRDFAQYHHVFPHTLENMNPTFASGCVDPSKRHSITVEDPIMQDATDLPMLDYKLKKYECLPQTIKVRPSVNCQMLVQESISTRIRSWLLKKFHRKRSNANLSVGQRFKRIRLSVTNRKISKFMKHIKGKGKFRNELKETHNFETFPKNIPVPPLRRRKRCNALNKQDVNAVLKNVMFFNDADNVKSNNKEHVNVNSTSINNINDESNIAKSVTEETHVDFNSINVSSSELSIEEPAMKSSSQKNIMNELKCIKKTDTSNTQNKNEVPIQLNAEDSFVSLDKNYLELETEVTRRMSLINTIHDLSTSEVEARQDVNKINSSSSITNSSLGIAELCETIKVPLLNNPRTNTITNCTTPGLNNEDASLDKKEFYRKKYQFLTKQMTKKKELSLKPPEAEDTERKMLVAKRERDINNVIQDEKHDKSDKERSVFKYKKHQNSYKRISNKKSKCIIQSLSLINEIEPLKAKNDSSLNCNSRIYKGNVTSLNKLYKPEVIKVQLISRGNELKDTQPETNKDLIPVKEYKMEDQSTQSYICYNNEKRNMQVKRSLSKVEVRLPITSIKSQDKDLSYGIRKVANKSVQPCLENRTESKRTTITDPYSISQEISQNKQTEKALASNGSRPPVTSSSITTKVNRRNPNENKLMYLSRIKKTIEESRNTKLSITKEIKAESDVVLQMSNDNCTTTEKRNKSIGYALVEEGLRIPENSRFLDSTEGDSKILKTRSEYEKIKILDRLMQVSEKVESTMVRKNSNSKKIESIKSKKKI